MAKVRTLQTNWARGELDPELSMRTDIAAYEGGAAVLRNFSLRPQGGGRRRPGTQYLADIGTPDAQFAEFVFSENQRYLLAFLNGSLRVFDMDGTLLTTVGGAPWGTAHLRALCYAQAHDTMIVCHPDLRTRMVVRTGASSFEIRTFAFETTSTGKKLCPFYKHADDTITLTPSATTGNNITLTLSAAHWQAGHVNVHIRYRGKQIRITEVTSGTVARGNVIEDLAGTTADADWEEEAFSPVFGWPRTVTFHDQRICFGGAKSIPDFFCASKPGAYFNFDDGSAAEGDAIVAAIGANRLNEIRGMASGRHLQIFTSDGPFYIPQSESRPMTPGNVVFRRQAPFGAAPNIMPRILDGATVFIQDGADVMRELLFDDTQQAYSAESVSLLSGHLLNDPVNITVVFGGAGQPDYFAVVLNADGSLAQFLSIRAESVAGWVGWEIGDRVHEICAVLSDLFMLVERTIDGQTVYWLEKLNWEPTWTLDAAKKATDTTAKTTWSGFDHLAGETVKAVSGRLYLGEFTVTPGGEITVNDAVTEILVGIDYTPRIQNLSIDVALGDGATTGVFKRMIRAVVGVHDTMAISVNGQRHLLRKVTDDLSVAPEPITGKIEFWLNGWSRNAQLEITQDEPLQLTVLGAMIEVEF